MGPGQGRLRSRQPGQGQVQARPVQASAQQEQPRPARPRQIQARLGQTGLARPGAGQVRSVPGHAQGGLGAQAQALKERVPEGFVREYKFKLTL